MNWLITGACGFIGTALVRRLCREGGHAIRVVDNLSVGQRKDLAMACKFKEASGSATEPFPDRGDVQLVVADILDANLAVKLARQTDVIVHLAANTGVGVSVEDPRTDCITNVVGTLNYLEGARVNNTGKFIFASSGAPVGEAEPPIHEEVVPRPVSPYGASKLAGEGYCSAYYRTYGVQTVALRFGNVYGPGSSHKDSVVARFIKQALAGEVLEIYGDGRQTRDFIYIDDLVDAVLLATKKTDVGGEVFQIATNSETTIAELSEMLMEALRIVGVNDIHVVNSNARLGDVQRNFSDTKKAKQLLGWVSAVDIRTGVRKTVQDYLLSVAHSG